MSVIQLDELAASIQKELSGYSKELSKQTKKAIDTAVKELIPALERDSPKRRGKYAKGWKAKRKTVDGMHCATVYNQRGSLTHLLENGHALRQGGRAQAFPHIAKNEQRAKELLEREIRKGIEHGY